MGAKPRPNEYVVLRRRDWLHLAKAVKAAGLDNAPELKRMRLWPMTTARPLDPHRDYLMREVSRLGERDE
jgi:hypothetical protein